MTLRIIAACSLLLLAPVALGQVSGVGENKPDLIREPYSYTSEQGEFTVTWPGGCGELIRRETADDPDADPFERVLVYNVYCDQNGQHGVGCSVSAVFNLKGPEGGPPGPPEVVKRMEDHMRALGVNVEQQTPIRKALADGSQIEGLDIRAREPEGPGEAWLRGLLHGGDIFLLSAWNIDGGLFADPEFQAFFNSFEPVIE